MYDPPSETLKGEVAAVEKFGEAGVWAGIGLRIKTSSANSS